MRSKIINKKFRSSRKTIIIVSNKYNIKIKCDINIEKMTEENISEMPKTAAVTRAKGEVIVISSEEIIKTYLNNKEKVENTIISHNQKMEIIKREYENIIKKMKEYKPKSYKEEKQEIEIKEINENIKLEINNINVKCGWETLNIKNERILEVLKEYIDKKYKIDSIIKLRYKLNEKYEYELGMILIKYYENCKEIIPITINEWSLN